MALKITDWRMDKLRTIGNLVMPIPPCTLLGVVCQHVCWQVSPCTARVGVASNNIVHLPVSGRSSLLESRVGNGIQGTAQRCVPKHTRAH